MRWGISSARRRAVWKCSSACTQFPPDGHERETTNTRASGGETAGDGADRLWVAASRQAAGVEVRATVAYPPRRLRSLPRESPRQGPITLALAASASQVEGRGFESNRPLQDFLPAKSPSGTQRAGPSALTSSIRYLAGERRSVLGGLLDRCRVRSLGRRRSGGRTRRNVTERCALEKTRG